MKIDRHAVPYYLVYCASGSPYVLNSERQVLRRGASNVLLAFAKSRGESTCLTSAAWDAFSAANGFSMAERQSGRCYSLVLGVETGHQLQLLITLLNPDR